MRQATQGSIEVGALLEAAVEEVRRIAPAVRFRTECRVGETPNFEIDAGWSIIAAIVKLGLMFRPGAATLVMRGPPELATFALELTADGVERESPVTVDEWRVVESSIATLDGLGGTFECRWTDADRRYEFRFTVPTSAIGCA